MLPSASDIERPAWTLAITTWVIGDLVTTVIGLSLSATEMNPLSASLIASFGLWIVVPFQLIALFGFGAVWWILYKRNIIARIGIPIGLSITGTAIVLNNLLVLIVLIL